MEKKYSVLMSVYYKENPVYFKESVLSMLNQSIVPNEVIIVKDGELSSELETVLIEFQKNSIIKVIHFKENVGLGKALNIGLKNCRNELIARMDTDDISKSDRCEKQIALFNSNENLSVVGSAIEEFINDPSNVVAYKDVKLKHNNISKQMKYRNPISHPSVMFKKSKVIEAGNYQHWLLNEDYYLWIRMLQNGAVFENIKEPLVKMRVTNDTYLRRGGWKYFLTQKKLFDYMLKNKMINVLEYLYNNTIRFVTRVLITNKMRKILYLNILRRKGVKND